MQSSGDKEPYNISSTINLTNTITPLPLCIQPYDVVFSRTTWHPAYYLASSLLLGIEPCYLASSLLLGIEPCYLASNDNTWDIQAYLLASRTTTWYVTRTLGIQPYHLGSNLTTLDLISPLDN